MEDEIEVKDISIGAFLLSSDKVRLVRTERKSRSLVVFYFAPKDEVEQLIALYWSDEASISPRKLFSNLRSLKDLIFSGT